LGLEESRNRLSLTLTGTTKSLLTWAGTSSNQAAASAAKLIFYFLGLLGDYDSMHMFAEDSVKHPPAVKARSIALLMKFKDEKLKGTQLIDENDELVVDCLGRPLIAIGGWKREQAQKSFCTFLSQFHQKSGHTGNYVAACDECIDVLNAGGGERMFGCPDHQPIARFRTSGNPVVTVNVKDAKKTLKVHMKGNPSNAKKAIDIFETLQIRAYLLSANCIRKMQSYTLFIVIIKLFLRISEGVHGINLATGDRETEASSRNLQHNRVKEYYSTGLTDKSFVLDAIHLRNGEVVSLVIKIMGKTDADIVYLKLSRDLKNSELCPVLHLLAYIYLIGYKGGHLFPTDQELKNRPTDGIYKTYKTFTTALDDLCKTFVAVTGLAVY
jgi:hypothetical protein